MFDVHVIREQFPILSRTVWDRPLVYLDNAATTQKPRCVIDAITDAYTTTNANVHRGVHHLSQLSTALHEEARETVRAFIGAVSTREIIFTRGTTDSINTLATSFGDTLQPGDEVIISEMDHHSNIVPWQLLRERRGIVLRTLPLTAEGTLDVDLLPTLLNARTRLVSVCHVSNVLGTVNPVRDIIRLCHDAGVPVCIDGAQSAPHLAVDVCDLDCDFYAFSAHKVYGPTGVGVLYGKESWLERLNPCQGGGEMISRVTIPQTTWAELPYKFEAGTPNYVGTTATAVALRFVSFVGLPAIAAHEAALTARAVEGLRAIPGITLYPENPKGSLVSFNVEGIHHSDIGTLLDHQGVAVRTGHHCAQPLMDHYGITGTVRASFALYNTFDEVDTFLNALDRSVNMLR